MMDCRQISLNLLVDAAHQAILNAGCDYANFIAKEMTKLLKVEFRNITPTAITVIIKSLRTNEMALISLPDFCKLEKISGNVRSCTGVALTGEETIESLKTTLVSGERFYTEMYTKHILLLKDIINAKKVSSNSINSFAEALNLKHEALMREMEILKIKCADFLYLLGLLLKKYKDAELIQHLGESYMKPLSSNTCDALEKLSERANSPTPTSVTASISTSSHSLFDLADAASLVPASANRKRTAECAFAPESATTVIPTLDTQKQQPASEKRMSVSSLLN